MWAMPMGQIVEISSLDDPRIVAYRNLKDRARCFAVVLLPCSMMDRGVGAEQGSELIYELRCFLGEVDSWRGVSDARPKMSIGEK